MPDVLLLHGFTGSSASWSADVVDGLASAGLRPVLVDLPGHGRHGGETDPDRFTLDAVEASLEEAATPRRRGVQPVDLIGYSMGGRLALAHAIRRPERVRRLVLESASPGLATAAERAERRSSDEALARALEERGIEAFVESWEAKPLFATRRGLPARVSAWQRAIRLRNDPRSLAASLRGLGTGALPSFWEELSGLRVPTLLLAGAEDTKFSTIARAMAERLPNARLRIVPGAGHTVHLERPDAWLEAVAEHLGGD